MKFLSTLLLFPLIVNIVQAQLPSSCTQAIIGLTDGWDSSLVTLSLVEKTQGSSWQRVLGPFPGRLGSKGCVWGLGLHQNPPGAPLKREGDRRTPAGIFAIGGLWTTNPIPVRHDRRMSEIRVDSRDLWVSDTRTPQLYNRHIRLRQPASTPWELHEQMKQNDAAHSIKLLICHNTAETPGRPVNGGGSSIFFHIWRKNGAAPTAGCTSLDEQNLRAIIARLNPARHPVYIMLPKAEYTRLRASWRLP